MFQVRVLAAWLFFLVFVAFLAAVGWAVWKGELGFPSGIGVVALGGLAIASFFLCVGAMESGEGFGLESHWGGLGGGVGGWRLTRPTVFLLAALFLAGASVTTVLGTAPSDRDKKDEASEGPTIPADADPPSAPEAPREANESPPEAQ